MLSVEKRLSMSLDQITMEDQKNTIHKLIKKNEKLDKELDELDLEMNELKDKLYINNNNNTEKINVLHSWRWHTNYSNNKSSVSGYLGSKLWDTSYVKYHIALKNAFIIITESDSVYKLYYVDSYE